MEPTLKEGDLLTLEKISNIVKPYRRGDIVQAFHPQDGSIIVKRIAGLPGETVDDTQGLVSVKTTDGHLFQLLNTFQTQVTPSSSTQVLGENEYFLLGDNRRSSIDSRQFGPVHRSNIIGRVWYIWSK